MYSPEESREALAVFVEKVISRVPEPARSRLGSSIGEDTKKAMIFLVDTPGVCVLVLEFDNGGFRPTETWSLRKKDLPPVGPSPMAQAKGAGQLADSLDECLQALGAKRP